MLRQAGTTSTKRNSAALSSASREARSIALSSSALNGWRVFDGSALASREPTANSSSSSALSSITDPTIPGAGRDSGGRRDRPSGGDRPAAGRPARAQLLGGHVGAHDEDRGG